MVNASSATVPFFKVIIKDIKSEERTNSVQPDTRFFQLPLRDILFVMARDKDTALAELCTSSCSS